MRQDPTGQHEAMRLDSHRDMTSASRQVVVRWGGSGSCCCRRLGEGSVGREWWRWEGGAQPGSGGATEVQGWRAGWSPRIQTCAVIFLSAIAPTAVDTRHCPQRSLPSAANPTLSLRSFPDQAQPAKRKLPRADIYTAKHSLPSRPNRPSVKCRNRVCAIDIPTTMSQELANPTSFVHQPYRIGAGRIATPLPTIYRPCGRSLRAL